MRTTPIKETAPSMEVGAMKVNAAHVESRSKIKDAANAVKKETAEKLNWKTME